MPVDLITPSSVFAYMGISPSADQTAAMTIISNAVTSEVKRFCRWCLTEKTHVEFFPRHGQSHGRGLRSTGRQPGYGSVLGGQDRLQLNQMQVTAISEIKEDTSFVFGSDTALALNEQWKPETIDSVLSKSGGILRIDACWPSLPLSVKASFTAGFTESDLAGDHNGLRFRALRECVTRWYKRQKEINTFVTDSTATGTIRREKLGVYEVENADPFVDKSGQLSELTDDFKEFLQDCGYVFMGVGV